MEINVTEGYIFNRDFLFPFERNFDFDESQRWLARNRHYLLYFIAVYVLFLYFGQIFMKNRPKFQLRMQLVVWNLGLSLFSILGALRNLPELIFVCSHMGFQGSVCVNMSPNINKVHAFWTFLFCLSKLPELGDTVFIILRKQKLIFLHWFHHIVTALYCWYSYEEYPSISRWFADMNLTIHSIMYGYFAVRAMGYSLPKWFSGFITTAQILQMAIGTTVSGLAYWKAIQGEACGTSLHWARISILMYFAYFLLFINFFIKSYLTKPKASGEAVSKKKMY